MNSAIDNSVAGKKIAVAMSGGVDSSLAAALLKAQGAEVIGFTLQLYDYGKAVASSKTCCAGRDIHDAKQVAAQLDIPHYVLDYQEIFQREVIDDFVDSYVRGETPIPCVRCNEKVKFVSLLDFAKELGADAFATGHYIHREGENLYCAKDEGRDQSYFLWTLTPEQLAFSCFPLGNLQKSEVRALAKEFNLSVADKPDSQDICFVPSGHYSDIVRTLRPEAEQGGEIYHLDGRLLGEHKGLYQFTIGQRRGLGLTREGTALYVVGFDREHARLIVGSRDDCAVCLVGLKDINWIGAKPKEDHELFVRLRTPQALQAARLEVDKVILETPQLGVAKGQACVFYQKCGKNRLRVLGGGWIDKTTLLPRTNQIATKTIEQNGRISLSEFSSL